jgi:hypothetical protein
VTSKLIGKHSAVEGRGGGGGGGDWGGGGEVGLWWWWWCRWGRGGLV